jgi:hypothetical protein
MEASRVIMKRFKKCQVKEYIVENSAPCYKYKYNWLFFAGGGCRYKLL